MPPRMIVTDASLAAGDHPPAVQAVFAILNAEPLPDHSTMAGVREQTRRDRAHVDVGDGTTATVFEVFARYDIDDFTSAANGCAYDEDEIAFMDSGISAVFDHMRSGLRPCEYNVVVLPGTRRLAPPSAGFYVAVDKEGTCAKQGEVSCAMRDHLVAYDGVDSAEYVIIERAAGVVKTFVVEHYGDDNRKAVLRGVRSSRDSKRRARVAADTTNTTSKRRRRDSTTDGTVREIVSARDTDMRSID